MILIILSLIMGYFGFNVGGLFEVELTKYLFGIVGVLSPGLYVLEQIYKEVKRSRIDS